MISNNKNVEIVSKIKQNRVFLWIASGTMILLIIPLALMVFKIPMSSYGSGNDVLNWDFTDFMLMGLLIFGISSIFVLIARRINTKYLFTVGIILFLLFLWIWAELAVGIFTNWGN